MSANTLIQNLWNYCNVLRDDGIAYGDYVEQLTHSPSFKISHERSRQPHDQPIFLAATP